MGKLVLIVATGREASAQTLTTLDSFSAAPQAVFDATEYCTPEPLGAGPTIRKSQPQFPGII